MARTTVLAVGFLLAGGLEAGLVDGLMLHYDFEELTGDLVVPDRSGNGYDGQVNGSQALSLEEGVFGNAGCFHEESGPVYIDLPAGIPHEEIPVDAITVAAWVKHDPLVVHMEIFMAMSSDPAKQLCHTEIRQGDMARFLIRTPIDPAQDIISINDVGSVPADEWVHYAATYDRLEGVGRLYIGGEIVGEQQATREMFNNWDTGARVGYTVDNARPFYGYMDDMAIWRRALAQDEIAELMERGIDHGVPAPRFRRGDVNTDGQVNIADAIAVLSHLFGRGGASLACADAADANDDSSINIADAIKILAHLFAKAGPLPEPFGTCAAEPSGDTLGCESFKPCEEGPR